MSKPVIGQAVLYVVKGGDEILPPWDLAAGRAIPARKEIPAIVTGVHADGVMTEVDLTIFPPGGHPTPLDHAVVFSPPVFWPGGESCHPIHTEISADAEIRVDR